VKSRYAAALFGLAVVVVLMFSTHQTRISKDITAIRNRYQEFQNLVSKGEIDDQRMLIAPSHRLQARNRNPSRLSELTLSKGSVIVVLSEQAWIYPEQQTARYPNFVYQFLSDYISPRGRGIEMSKVDGKWYFTGSIHID
jgi:hypothetical protein